MGWEEAGMGTGTLVPMSSLALYLPSLTSFQEITSSPALSFLESMRRDPNKHLQPPPQPPITIKGWFRTVEILLQGTSDPQTLKPEIFLYPLDRSHRHGCDRSLEGIGNQVNDLGRP